MKAKKIVSLLLAAAMTVSMAACGGGNQTSASKTTATMQRGMLQTKMQRRVEYPRELPKNEAEDLADIIPEETVTLDVFDQLANYSGERDRMVWSDHVRLNSM